MAGEAAVIVSDEAQPTTPTSVALRWLINIVAVAMSLYHMYVAAFGPPEAIVFRGTHLLFALTLVFLLYPLTSFSTTTTSSTASSTSMT